MRKILHVDADSFFASVEVRDNPKLAGRPVAVGGDPGRRGVICTASYEARKYGVRSAMASAHAARLCPELIILKPNMSRYKEASQAMRSIFARYTDCIEQLSLDEAYLDVSAASLIHGSATAIAQHIQKDIQRELMLNVSVGAAPVKFVAKIASDWRKPNGLFVVKPADVESFCAKLPTRRLPGVGQVTHTKLTRFGLYECEQIRQFGEHALVQHFGTFGHQLFERAWGRDDSQVQTDRVRKSLSVERTFDSDLPAAGLNIAADALAQDLAARYVSIQAKYSPIKQFVKLKFSDFTQTVLEAALPQSAKWPPTSYFERLLHMAWHRYQLPVRLVGIGVRLKQHDALTNPDQFHQMRLFS